MKVLLTGASGLVGSAFARTAAGRRIEVVGVVGRWTGALPGLCRQLAADLQDEEVVKRLVRDVRPDWIVNAAAISEPGQCDAEPERARRLNVALPERLARSGRDTGARLLHLSTEQVFDGNAPPYAVGDSRRAINLYARHKLESEDAVLAAAPDSAVLRLPLLMGNSPGGRRSVHERLLLLWSAGKPARLYRDEIRQTCTADSVARAMLELCERGAWSGPLHWAGAEPVSRLAIGERIRAHFGFPDSAAPIIGVNRSEDPAAMASRQADLSLALAPLDKELGIRPQTFAEALGELVLPSWFTGLR